MNAPQTNAQGWTAPYYGVQHYGNFSTTSFWATVHDYGGFATASVWTPGCAFSPMESHHDSAQAAREHAETQLHDLTQRRMGKPTANAGGAR